MHYIVDNETLLPNTPIGLLLWTFAGLAAFVAASTVPIAMHLALLAMFGLAHVLMELRYVDGRFSQRLEAMPFKLILIMLVNIAMVRILVAAAYIYAPFGSGIEIAFGAGLAALAAASASNRASLIIIIILVLSAIGMVSTPNVMIAIAILHNLTPLGFFAEALPVQEARNVISRLAIPFFIVPCIIASGLPRQALAFVFTCSPFWIPLKAGSTSQIFSAFLPSELLDSTWAIDAFAAVVFAQSMHYLAVIVVLPRVARAKKLTGQTVVPWPQGLVLFTCVTGLSVLLLLYFILDYHHARMVYSTFAAIHAWIEVPILIMAFSGGLRRSFATTALA